jgi:hypothetical protein
VEDSATNILEEPVIATGKYFQARVTCEEIPKHLFARAVRVRKALVERLKSLYDQARNCHAGKAMLALRVCYGPKVAFTKSLNYEFAK